MWNSNAKGVYFGLTIQHKKAHLIKASLEGIIFSLYSIGKILMEKKEITEIYASGGFAKSVVWLQILADVFNIKVFVSAAAESAALGSVMLGAEAAGIKTDFQHQTSAVYFPDKKNNDIYRKSFEKFERLYELLKGEMVNENQVNV